ALPLGLGELGPGGGEALLGSGEGRRGDVVRGVEVQLALVEAGDLGLEADERLLGLLRAGPRLLERPLEAVDLRRPGLDPSAGGLLLAGQPGQALPTVRLRTAQRGDAVLLVGERELRSGPGALRGAQPFGVRGDGGCEPGLLGAGPGGLLV